MFSNHDVVTDPSLKDGMLAILYIMSLLPSLLKSAISKSPANIA